MDEIKKWLADDDGTFEEGYALLMARSRNRHILQYLDRKKDMPKLRYELGKFVSGPDSEELENDELERKEQGNKEPEKRKEPILVKPAASETETLQKPHERLRIIAGGMISYKDLPDILKPVYETAIETYQKMRSVHERMKIVTTDEERQAARAELLELEVKRAAAWAVIDKWGETGELPEPKSEGTDSKSEEPAGYKSVNAARTAVSRYLRELDAEPEMDPAKRAELIEKVRHAVAVVTAAGGKFDKLLEPLKKYGIINP